MPKFDRLYRFMKNSRQKINVELLQHTGTAEYVTAADYQEMRRSKTADKL
ncbi:hypothetical protein [Leptolyngbya ohadii]|nr:hypothetical protein [Leptolyngbya ohadii]